MSCLAPGIKGEARIAVTSSNTALTYGSGTLKVLATPAMICLMEKAAMTCVQPHLCPGETTVGISVDVKHLSATPEGMDVVASCELVAIEGKKLVFNVEACDGAGLIGKGVHERYIIQEESFLEKVQKKL